MTPDNDLLDLSPPEASGWGLSFWLALLVHLALIVALSLGISWHHDATTAAVQAELWSAVPMEAAPATETPSEATPTVPPEVTPPTPTPPPAPEPVKPPPPPPKATPAPQPDPQIALEKERKLKEKKLKEEKLAQEKRDQDLKDKKAKEAKEAEKLAKAKEQAKELAKEQAKAKEEAQRAEAQRAENLKRLQKMAGAAGGSGAPGSAGQAARSAGPSGSYAGKVKQRVQPHITFDAKDTIGNPVAEVEVRAAPDGTITQTKLTKSSGVPAWDDAVLRALDKTQSLPRDEDGRVPPSMILVFRPKD